ncbi:hypothetical protein HYPSUDRAFT_209836 [Hypholoma sublateritium FD-334 SS-4]|uniref:Uncharacterized protein n=1 Tax=Hypholoma sublateritium (strain FD-334 SS-4) TaxID=945553 RepID=A0A0D2NX46_HYPSF|nr:hypothetical protein HYPSUDRAFT_209836 [Hypholoma sublateritium FD-334 SS-4]
MGQISFCKGSGKELSNWGRHYQMCVDPQCIASGGGVPMFFWNDEPTHLDLIPDGIKMKFAMKQSIQDSVPQTPCQQLNCFTSSGKLNLGGCKLPAHRLGYATQCDDMQEEAEKKAEEYGSQLPSSSFQNTASMPSTSTLQPSTGQWYACAMHPGYS